MSELRKINLDPNQNSNKIVNQIFKIIIELLIIIKVSSKIDHFLQYQQETIFLTNLNSAFVFISVLKIILFYQIFKKKRKIILRNNVKSLWKMMMIWLITYH